MTSADEFVSAAGMPRDKKKSQATELADLVMDRYELGMTPDAEPYAVPKNGPRVPRLLRSGRDSLRCELATTYAEEHDRAPSAQALADALLVTEGRAAKLDPTPLHLRVARHHDGIVLDLGDRQGRVTPCDRQVGKSAIRLPVRCSAGPGFLAPSRSRFVGGG